MVPIPMHRTTSDRLLIERVHVRPYPMSARPHYAFVLGRNGVECNITCRIKYKRGQSHCHWQLFLLLYLPDVAHRHHPKKNLDDIAALLFLNCPNITGISFLYVFVGVCFCFSCIFLLNIFLFYFLNFLIVLNRKTLRTRHFCYSRPVRFKEPYLYVNIYGLINKPAGHHPVKKIHIRGFQIIPSTRVHAWRFYLVHQKDVAHVHFQKSVVGPDLSRPRTHRPLTTTTLPCSK